MDEVHEKCGVAAVHIKNGGDENVVPYLYKLLLNLQNRGQLSAGISTYNKDRPKLIDTYKQIGTVNEAFKTSNPIKTELLFRKFAGSVGIGHVRYATCGANDKNYAMPFERPHGRLWKWFSFAFNGNIANYAKLRKPLLEKSGYHFILNVDTEIMMHYLSRAQMRNVKTPLPEVFKQMGEALDGAYCMAYLNADGDLAVVRDPWGFRPMAYGYLDDKTFIAASETNALSNVGVKEYHYLKPGELLQIKKDGKLEVKQCIKSNKKSYCMFEWVYFANVSSILEGKSVYVARTNLGRELAKLETEPVNKDEYIVVPVPDTAKAAGDAMAYELGIPSEEGLMRNRFVGRTFIEDKKSRKMKIRTKFSIIKEIIRDKKIILVDDSLVRGTTLKELISYLRTEGGAKEVHVRISCPPIIGPCFYGIDMSTISELWAPNMINEMDAEGNYDPKYHRIMADEIGADSLIYNTIEGTVRSIGLPKQDLCLACLNGQHPTPCGRELYKIAEDNFKNGSDSGRTYDC